ncbi:MAG: M23 family metallopeptidase, partial [Candidatus Kapabacteria bacterium]|nr:M23 family metallopeptidase [Candidatus Kapabacteria bacterium]
RRKSATVRIGDSVRKGQRMAFIGSSGTSEDPHLHFEVWLNIDPFTGSCSSRSVRWDDQPDYTSTYELLDADVTTWPPLLDTLRERPPSASSIAKGDTSITFWALQRHVKPTDRLGVTWLTPDNEVWFRYEADAGMESTYFYWWSWIQRPAIAGLWKVEYRMNDTIVTTRTFRVLQTVSVDSNGGTPAIEIRRFGDVLRCTMPEDGIIRVYDGQGRMVLNHDVRTGTNAIIAELPPVALIEVVSRYGVILARTIAGAASVSELELMRK